MNRKLLFSCGLRRPRNGEQLRTYRSKRSSYATVSVSAERQPRNNNIRSCRRRRRRARARAVAVVDGRRDDDRPTDEGTEAHPLGRRGFFRGTRRRRPWQCSAGDPSASFVRVRAHVPFFSFSSFPPRAADLVPTRVRRVPRPETQRDDADVATDSHRDEPTTWDAVGRQTDPMDVLVVRVRAGRSTRRHREKRHANR